MSYDPKHIATLLFKHLAGDISEKEKLELDNWRQASPGRQSLLSEIEDPEILGEFVKRGEPSKLAPVSARMLERIELAIGQMDHESQPAVTPVHRVHFLKTAWFKYAAAILIIAGIGAYLWSTQQKEKPVLTKSHPAPVKNDIMPGKDRAILTLSNGKKIELSNATSETINDGAVPITNSNGQLLYSDSERGSLSSAGGGGRSLPAGRQGGPRTATNTMSTPRGGQYQLTLSDGTRVWLNAASSITYPIAFTGSTRQVSITGEAYLEVAKNPKMPFRVNISDRAEIDVLGTSFNINAYENEKAIKTTLVEGAVLVKANQRQQNLQPGQQAQLDPGKKINVINGANIEKVVAWKKGYFNFDDADIYQVMRQLERWYDIDVIYEKSIRPVEFHGKLPRNLTLVQVLRILGEMEVKFRIEGRKLVITQ